MTRAAAPSAGLCIHCGLPAAGAPFCCTGCSLVHSLLGRRADEAEGEPDRLLARVLLSAFLSMGVMVFSLALYGIDPAADGEAPRALQGLYRLGAFALSLPVLFLLGVPLADAAWRARRLLSADVLILAGTTAAWTVSAWNTLTDGGRVYFETATMVLVLVALGRWMDARARERARADLRVLTAERVRPATRVKDGAEQEVALERLRRGDLVRVRPGETVPVDGVLVEGASFVDTADLTGEDEPRSARSGDRVLAGSRAVDGTFVLRAEAAPGDCVRDEVERELARALASQPSLVRLADRAAGAFLPLVVAIALGTAAWRWRVAGPEDALLDALSVVLIACPCALGLATPMAFWVALGAAWKRGVLVRGGEVFQRLARVRRVFLDKTGTLTDAELELVEIQPLEKGDAEELLAVAAAVERGSEHPIGRAVRRAAGDRPSPAVSAFRALPGVGVEGVVEGRRVTLRRHDASDAAGRTLVRMTRNGEPAADLLFASRLRPEAAATVRELDRRGLTPRVLTGDGQAAGEALARRLDVPVEAELLPQDKVARVRGAGATGVLVVGDGLNDAAALAAADVGVALAEGSPKSLESADVQLLRGRLDVLPGLLDLGRRAVTTARANLVWAFAYNAIGIGLAAAGRLSPIFAASAMVVSSAVVVLNSSRLRSA